MLISRPSNLVEGMIFGIPDLQMIFGIPDLQTMEYKPAMMTRSMRSANLLKADVIPLGNWDREFIHLYPS